MFKKTLMISHKVFLVPVMKFHKFSTLYRILYVNKQKKKFVGKVGIVK